MSAQPHRSQCDGNCDDSPRSVRQCERRRAPTSCQINSLLSLSELVSSAWLRWPTSGSAGITGSNDRNPKCRYIRLDKRRPVCRRLVVMPVVLGRLIGPNLPISSATGALQTTRIFSKKAVARRCRLIRRYGAPRRLARTAAMLACTRLPSGNDVDMSLTDHGK